MSYTRALKFTLPMMRGEDVLDLQLQLRRLGHEQTGQPDGLFGRRTAAAVRAFQERQEGRLQVDGIVGPLTWTEIFGSADPEQDKIKGVLSDLTVEHGYRDSVRWRLTGRGLLVGGAAEPESSGGEPTTVRQVWRDYGAEIENWAAKFGVPCELIVATICTESSGNPRALRTEPGYAGDERTPDKVSVGLMQTLISTARDTLGEEVIDRAWLLTPGNSIRAGTAYIASQFNITGLDPPKVACAYNAGNLYYNDGPRNRWRMRQYPIGTAEHADRFVRWFNDCFRLFVRDQLSPGVSFYSALRATDPVADGA